MTLHQRQPAEAVFRSATRPRHRWQLTSHDFSQRRIQIVQREQPGSCRPGRLRVAIADSTQWPGHEERNPMPALID